MQKITTETGHTIELYDSIDEMPMVRYQRYNQLMVLGVGASTDINDIRRKIATIGKMIDADMAKEAKVELNNLNMQMVVTAASIDTRSRAFACLVKSIDGKPCDDITADGIKRTAEYLDTILTKGERDTTNDGVKKKNRE